MPTSTFHTTSRSPMSTSELLTSSSCAAAAWAPSIRARVEAVASSPERRMGPAVYAPGCGPAPAKDGHGGVRIWSRFRDGGAPGFPPAPKRSRMRAHTYPGRAVIAAAFTPRRPRRPGPRASLTLLALRRRLTGPVLTAFLTGFVVAPCLHNAVHADDHEHGPDGFSITWRRGESEE